MNALIRKISPYTGADILLGIFLTETDALRAREAYLSRYLNDPASDPWRRQSYQPDGIRAKDLQILSLNFSGSPRDGDEVIVVSDYENMFGQIFRELDSIHLSKTGAEKRVSEIDQNETTIPSYALLQHVRIGVVLSDRPEDQPSL